MPPVAAIAHALYDAIGVRLTELPMKPSRVLAAIEAKARQAQQAAAAAG